MPKKLEFKINLINSTKKIFGYNTDTQVYMIKIIFFHKDERFDSDEYDKKCIMYTSKLTNFFIGVDPDKPNGELDYCGLYLPSYRHINNKHILSIMFHTDENRKIYLKKLYLSLKDWNKNWFGFYYDTGNGFKYKDNKFIYYCNYISYDI